MSDGLKIRFEYIKGENSHRIDWLVPEFELSHSANISADLAIVAEYLWERIAEKLKEDNE